MNTVIMKRRIDSNSRRTIYVVSTLIVVIIVSASVQQQQHHATAFTISLQQHRQQQNLQLQHSMHNNDQQHQFQTIKSSSTTTNTMSIVTDSTTDHLQRQVPWAQTIATIMLGITVFLSSSILLPNIALAENELSAKYGNSGFDSSLVDQTCLLDHCSLQAKACLQDDPSCRKGLTCTAKCLGDNACITGCMARYGDKQLDSLLKCTIEDHECIKIAILPGGSDVYGTEPKSPIPTVPAFDYHTMEGSWYKVIGYNPNYDCYACQRNTFTSSPSSSTTKGSGTGTNTLQMDVEFSMPHLLPDGSPLPPSGTRETVDFLLQDQYDDVTDDMTKTVSYNTKGNTGLQSIALNDYHTHEIMIFDTPQSSVNSNNNPIHQFITFNKGTQQEQSYSRTAHSEGEMFGLKFWENWYIIGENDKESNEEFKFVYYNGKTRQNTYEGAFIYSRSKDLSPDSMKRIYQIATDAGMDPNQFCRIRNGCFTDENANGSSIQRKDSTGLGSPNNPFRGILASTRVSELLGVEPVAARDMLRRSIPTAPVLTPDLPILSSDATNTPTTARHWWYEVGDYLENPHRHFKAMDQLRQPMIWPKDILEPSR